MGCPSQAWESSLSSGVLMSPQPTRTRGTIRRRPVPSHPLGGIRFVIATYSPEFDVVAPEPLPGMHVEDGDEPGMHRTDSTDFGVVLSGNVAIELDDGVEVLLSPGDVVVQNGTRHRWRVVGGVPATVAAFIIGAHRR